MREGDEHEHERTITVVGRQRRWKSRETDSRENKILNFYKQKTACERGVRLVG